MVFNRDYRGARRAGDVRWLAAAGAALGCGVLPLHEKSNAQGLLDMGANPAWYPGYRPVTDPADDRRPREGLERVAARPGHRAGRTWRSCWPRSRSRSRWCSAKIRSAPTGLPAELRDGLEAAEFLVVADLFATKTAQAAHVVLPMSSTPETAGTMTNSERRVQMLARAIPARAGLETWELLTELAARMGLKFKMNYTTPSQVFEEIRRVAPIYRYVDVGSQGPDAIWDASRLSMKPAALNGTATAPVLTPVETGALDYLDARFERWFDGLFKDR